MDLTMTVRDRYLVDTNVLISANGKDEDTPEECILSCIHQLESIKESGKVVLDNGWLVLKEYLGNVNSDNGGGVGSQFLQYILSHQWDTDSVECREITDDGNDSFNEYPSDPLLSSFDPSDKKFIALCALDTQNSVIIEATDTDFWKYEIPMSRSGIEISFICQQYIDSLAARKNETKLP